MGPNESEVMRLFPSPATRTGESGFSPTREESSFFKTCVIFSAISGSQCLREGDSIVIYVPVFLPSSFSPSSEVILTRVILNSSPFSSYASTPCISSSLFSASLYISLAETASKRFSPFKIASRSGLPFKNSSVINGLDLCAPL